jgi:glycosyltransferase involved in cell wall biosynthesis
MRTSIVVPCYNEEKNIPLILERFSREAVGCDLELILVDNGSSDRTPEVLKELLPRHPFARTVRVEVNQGYGFGILQGLKVASGDYLGWTHADLQTDPADCSRAVEIIRRAGCPRNIFVKGSRRGRPISDEIFTWGMGVFETILFGRSLWDINAQPNCFHRSFYEAWQDPPHDFALDLFALCQAQVRGFTIVRFSVEFPERKHGTSSWNTGLRSKWKFIARTLTYSRSLKQRMKV